MIPDAASKLSAQFLVGSFIPAALLIGAIAFSVGVLPTTTSNGTSSTDWTTLAGGMFVSALVLAVLLDTVNFFLIRVLEGLIGLPAEVARRGREKHAARLKDLVTHIEALNAQETDEKAIDKAYKLEKQRFESYPTAEDVLPTALGNRIAAWEHYPYRRYGIDAIALWPRLAPLLSKPVSNQIASAKATFDLLINAMVLLPVWGVLRAAVLADAGTRWSGVVWLVVSAFAAFLIWRFCLVPAATTWGDTVKAAFDLHRLDVLRQMGVMSRPFVSPRQEQQLWREVIWPMKFEYEPSLTYSMRGGEAAASDARSGGDEEAS